MLDYMDKHQLVGHQPRQVLDNIHGQHSLPSVGQQQLSQLQQQQQYPHQPALNQQQQPHQPHQQLLVDIQSNAIQPLHQKQTAIATTPAQPQSQAIQQQQQGSNNELIGYYFGSISRETAEWILRNHGNQMDGAYLLRSSGPNDDFVLSLLVDHGSLNQNPMQLAPTTNQQAVGQLANFEVLHYKIVETEDSFVALHGQVADEKFATIDELIEKAQGVATKPRWPIQRQSLESQILPPTYWGLTVDQVRLAILLKAKQWGFPLFSSLFHQPANQIEQQTLNLPNINSVNSPTHLEDASHLENSLNNNITTLNNETIRTLIYKSLHEFQPWFHGRISREEAERRIEDGSQKDGRFLVRERDNYSYAVCICHKRTTKHYRIDVLPTGELAIQDGRKFTSLMALVSHYTIMSDGLWCALTEACPRPIQASAQNAIPISRPDGNFRGFEIHQANNLYCVPPTRCNTNGTSFLPQIPADTRTTASARSKNQPGGQQRQPLNALSSNQTASSGPIQAPIKEWLHNINAKLTQLMSKNQHQSLNSFLFGPSNPLNNHCKHNRRGHLRDRGHSHHHHHHHHHHQNQEYHRKKCKNVHSSSCISSNQVTSYNSGASGSAHNSKTLTRADQAKQLAFSKQDTTPRITNITCGCCNSIDNSQALRCIDSKCMANFNMRPNAIQMLQQPHQNGFISPQALVNLPPPPQNPGLTLNGQSFIGSPLFAVKTLGPSHSKDNGHPIGRESISSSSNSNSNSNNSGHSVVVKKISAGEEKLISPAQSVASNLNNSAYNIGTEIYRSPASTAIVNDHLPQHYSSSSMGNNPTYPLGNQMAQQPGSSVSQNDRMISLGSNMGQFHKQPPAPALVNQSQASMNTMPPPPLHQMGPIVCGQHAGPAYRYTNCGGNENLGGCLHSRQLRTNWAADDSHLVTPSTQLVGPAALAKFVQFQDGQCLRTHRDTRSIQMAYLSSRLQPQQNIQRIPIPKTSSQTANHKPFSNGFNTSRLYNPAQMAEFACPEDDGGPTQVPASSKDIDLIDCDGDGFNFKYDPKLIKSSSIETLCGAAEDEQQDDLVDCKTNSELLMSLQSCWFNSNNNNNNNNAQLLEQDDILHPEPTYQQQAAAGCNNLNGANGVQEQAAGAYDQQSILSHLINDATRTNDQGYDYMKSKHDLDDYTTAQLSELTATLKALVDLKNKQSGFATNLAPDSSKQANSSMNQHEQDHHKSQQQQTGGQQEATRPGGGQPASSGEANPRELVNEFDILKIKQI